MKNTYTNSFRGTLAFDNQVFTSCWNKSFCQSMQCLIFVKIILFSGKDQTKDVIPLGSDIFIAFATSVGIKINPKNDLFWGMRVPYFKTTSRWFQKYEDPMPKIFSI